MFDFNNLFCNVNVFSILNNNILQYLYPIKRALRYRPRIFKAYHENNGKCRHTPLKGRYFTTFVRVVFLFLIQTKTSDSVKQFY